MTDGLVDEVILEEDGEDVAISADDEDDDEATAVAEGESVIPGYAEYIRRAP